MVDETDNRWIIKEFKHFVEHDLPIVSPTFSITTGGQVVDVESFHVEMIPEMRSGRCGCYRCFAARYDNDHFVDDDEYYQCPVVLIKETKGSVMGNIDLITLPREIGLHQTVSGIDGKSFGISPEKKKEIFSVRVPASFADVDENVTIALKLSIRRPSTNNK